IGNYSVTVTDANDCTIESNTFLIQPDSITIEYSITQPDCSSATSGIIKIDSVYGGVEPYTYLFKGKNATNNLTFENLKGGYYSFEVIDKNNCNATIISTLLDPLIPDIELGPDLTINLGDQIPLHIYNNQFVDKYIWSLKEGLSCYDCPDPLASPYINTTYILNVISPTFCTYIDSINISIIQNRRVFVPNAFSPNGDGINDRLTVYAGPEVLKIKSFNIYSRWGEHIFEQNDFPPNALHYGWDGKARNKEFGPATFVWVAEVEFLDGLVLLYKGDVNILK
ncbi:MAG TPA: gliding motility-associated C-terminal domain-containing protein, partial [Saprospiraceae bacterium]|nr:gliding motility-associated C-terminal domain-containing protein [Saprospiraceae bacterium]